MENLVQYHNSFVPRLSHTLYEDLGMRLYPYNLTLNHVFSAISNDCAVWNVSLLMRTLDQKFKM